MNIDERWTEIKLDGKNLEGRSYHSLILYNDKIITYGGYEIEKGITDDFYEMKLVNA